MKRIFHFLSVCIIFSACTKGHDLLGSSDPASTDLQISITRDASPVAGAIVTLYGSENDFLTRSNHLYSTSSNSSGQALFKNLQSKKYYFFVQKDCMDNTIGNTSTFSGLTSGITNSTSTSLKSMGTLKFVNNSSNPYKIYLNNTLAVGSMAGNSSGTLHMPAGFYTVRVVQISGYIFTPTDITYSGVLACGGTLTTSFP